MDVPNKVKRKLWIEYNNEYNKSSILSKYFIKYFFQDTAPTLAYSNISLIYL